MKKRWLPRAVAGSVVLAPRADAGRVRRRRSGSSGSGSFTVLVYGDASNKVEKQIVDTFNKTSKVKAVLDTIPGADYQTKLQTIINTKQAPDVFFNWGGGSIPPFVKADLLLPLDDMIAKDPGLKSNFLPSVFNRRDRGRQVLRRYRCAAPSRSCCSTTRRSWPTPASPRPKTWDDLLNARQGPQGQGRHADRARRRRPVADADVVRVHVRPHSRARAVREGHGAATSPPGTSADSRAALAKLKELIDAGAFGTNYDSVKYTDGGSRARWSRSGKAGFELMGSWYVLQAAEDNPDFAKNGLGYSSFPTVDGGKGDPTDIVGNTNNFYSVLKKTKHADAIAQFLKLHVQRTSS